MAYFPIQIDPLAGPNIVIFGMQPFLNDPGVFKRGTNLYRCGSYTDLTNILGESSTRVWKSSDAGKTWTALDTANEPFLVANYRCGVFDGANTITFAILPEPLPGTPVFLQNFDLATGTWGLPFGIAGAPTPLGLSGIYRRSTGDLVLVSQYPDPGPLPSPFFGFQVFSAGLWSPIVDLATNVQSLPLFPVGVSVGVGTIGYPAVMDSSDRLHVFFTIGSFLEDPIGWDARTFYQQVLPSNALGPFFDFPGQGVTPVDIQNAGAPTIAGNSIVWPVTRFLPPGSQYMSVFAGTPLAAPVWTAVGPPGIDPASYGVFVPNSYGMAGFDGSDIFVCFIQTTDLIQIRNQIRVCQTGAPLGPWSASTLFDYLTDPAPPGFNFNGQAMFIEPVGGGSLLTSVAALNPVAGLPTGLWFLAPPAGIFGGIVVLKGVKRVKLPQCDTLTPAPVSKPVKMAF
jgi:hypothetical protein